MARAGPRNVDAYIAAAPRSAQPMLRQLRQAIKAAAPKARETISYGMPYYEYHGRLVYFAAYKNHVGVYAVGPATTYAQELKDYMTGKGTLRFPVGDPLPVALIQRMVEARVKENEANVRERDGIGSEGVGTQE